MKRNTDEIPPFDFVREVLHKRIDDILFACKADNYTLYLTSGRTFRFDIAKCKPYKGSRIEKKPWHYENLTVYMRDILGATVCTYIEADDAMAIDHVNSEDDTILASRDKDTKQIPGWAYSWELGNQPSFGPTLITKEGDLKLIPANPEKKKPAKLMGTGLSWFYAQVLMGDPVDNIPGLPNCGPVAAYNMLTKPITASPEASEERELLTPAEQLDAVREAYRLHYYEADGWYKDGVEAYYELLEQGRLCWLTRRLNEDGTPQLWEIGLDE